MTHTLYNTDKGRKATPNELAKRAIINQLEGLVAMNEVWGHENLTDEEADEVIRFYNKHLAAISKKLNTPNIQWK